MAANVSTLPDSYTNPPIVEVIVEATFVDPVTRPALNKALQRTIQATYTGTPYERRRLNVVVARQHNQATASAHEEASQAFFPSPDGKQQLGLADNALSIHQQAPYPGWGAVVERVRAVFEDLGKELDGEPGLQALAVRYIDLVTVPPDQPPIDYVSIFPVRPDGAPNHLVDIDLTTRSVDPATGTSATITLFNAKHHDDVNLTLVLDICLERAAAEGWRLSDPDAWMPVLDSLHVAQRRIFEASITDKLRSTFR